MCIAIPKKIVRLETIQDVTRAIVSRLDSEEAVGLTMVPHAQVGDIVLVFQGNALRIVDEEEARRIEAALSCLGEAVAGESIEASFEAAFGDLINNPAQLPPHLQAQVGKKVL